MKYSTIYLIYNSYDVGTKTNSILKSYLTWLVVLIADRNIFPNDLLVAKILKTTAPESLNIYPPLTML